MEPSNDNNIDWIVASIPADEKLPRRPTTGEVATSESQRRRALAEQLLAGKPDLSIEDAGGDPYNSSGRASRK
jgi:hypothetical protein